MARNVAGGADGDTQCDRVSDLAGDERPLLGSAETASGVCGASQRTDCQSGTPADDAESVSDLVLFQ